MNHIKIDFTKKIGSIKPMHGVGAGPKQGGALLSSNVTEIFNEIGVPFSRLHDIEGAYSQNQYVDIHCVFPNFDADENNPDSYNFKPTDNYIKAILDAGTKVFYRLGESIDHYPNKLFVRPPKDIEKWARICEHIILHYNYGWANGFEFNIEYWEIWNEPDNPRMWVGSFEEFYNLYKTTAVYLKKRFPTLKIGGYSASGFYTETRPLETCGEWFKTLVPWTERFFEKLAVEPQKVPMDFFSWHCYANRPEEINLFANFTQNLLKKYGYTNTESILTEYNTFSVFANPPSRIREYGAELAAGLIVAQNSPLDAVMYYDMRFISMNGIFARDIYYKLNKLHGFYALKSFGDIFRLENQFESDCDNKEVYVLAAKNGDKAGIMLSVRDYSGTLYFDCKSLFNAEILVKRYGYEDYDASVSLFQTDNGFAFEAQKDCIYYIDIKSKE